MSKSNTTPRRPAAHLQGEAAPKNEPVERHKIGRAQVKVLKPGTIDPVVAVRRLRDR